MAVVVLSLMVALTVVRTSFSALPSAGNVALFAICIVAARKIREIYARLTIYVWLTWYIVGSFSYVGWYLAFDRYARVGGDPSIYGYIYLVFILAATLGAIGFTRTGRRRQAMAYDEPREYDLPSLPVTLVFLLFPLAFAASIYVTFNGFPLLKGVNIIDTLYVEANPLAVLGALMIYAVAYCYLISRCAQNKNVRLLKYAHFLIVPFLLISMLDGKRVLPLMAIGLIGMVWYAHEGRKASKVQLLLGVAAVLAVYLGGHFLRTGGEFQINDVNGITRAVGGEFVDSVYVNDAFDRDALANAGYDWWRSTAASIVNRNVLDVFGVDKAEWVPMDSARSIMRLYRGMFGIRVGIVTEFWLAFGWLGLFAMAIFGYAIAWLSNVATQTRSMTTKITALTVLSVFLLSIMSQSTVTFGALPMIFYLFLGLKAADLLMAARGSSRRLNRSLIAR